MNKDITLEDLGYECKETEDYIEYEKYDDYNRLEISLMFWKNGFNKMTIGMEQVVYALDMQELQAIYNKCKELGWLDE